MHEILQHTADVRLHVTASTLEELFADALRGLMAVMHSTTAGDIDTVQIEVDAAQLAQAAALVPTVRRTGDRAVSYQSATARDMIRCFKTVTTMISAAIENHYG